ncbi:MAG: hypothetical protein AB1391_02190 [Candidatus Micrarchaeota archaeon]
MLPEGKLIKDKLVLYELGLPDDIKLTKKSLIRWIALSLGLISPNESRTISINVFETLINFHLKGIEPTMKEIIKDLASNGVKADEKSVYYHILKMKEINLIRKKNGKYFFWDGIENKLSQTIKKLYQEKFDRSFKNIDNALNALENYKY